MSRRSFLTIALLITSFFLSVDGRAQNPRIRTTGPVTTVQGTNIVKPATGTQGTGVQYNFLPYIYPGQYANPTTNVIENDPFDIAYLNRSQPLQTSDWWTGIGLQWSGWVQGRPENEGAAGRSTGFISEPFQMQFLDVGPGKNDANVVPGIPLPVQGLRFWNQNAISYKTDGRIKPGDSFNASLNFAGRGEVSRQTSPIVTVGLANVHPLGLTPPTKAPWSNVKVRSYSDWGAVVSYTDAGNEMTVTMANGSPFVWMERTSGNAAFTLWVGDLETSGSRTVWYNQGGIIGVTVKSAYNPFNGLPQATSTAAYVIISDAGTWGDEKTATNGAAMSMFTNTAARRVAVLAMPHNINPADSNALIQALNDLKQYACVRIVDTKLHFSPIPGSDASVTSNGDVLPIGYDEKKSVLRSKMEAITAPFPLQNCNSTTPALQIVLPHHQKTMIPSSKANLLPQYKWNGVIGELVAYKGNSYVRELRAKGVLPFFPAVVANSTLQNPLQSGQSAVEDIYQTMKTWYFVEEPIPQGHLDSFVRNLGTYISVQNNTYIQGIAALYEAEVIADQLSKSPGLTAIDPDFDRTKQQVAVEMRDNIRQALKELVGQWADVYTAQFFQYSPLYNSLFGWPDGYGSVQNFNDHHYHYSYFLKAAAAIGRFDLDWLKKYMPLIDQIRRDVATYDRSDPQFPFLREFSPFYGHNWSNGTSDAGGNDQESTSEALNFAVGLLELGQVLDNKAWRDLGMYLYEEEILATEQYWFNQDADLSKSSGTFYNGNWPDALVRYTGEDGTTWKTTLITNVKQFGVFRNTFFGGIKGSYAIQGIPLSAFTAYLGRNTAWLSETWKQYLLDSKNEGDGIYDVVIAGIQARLPQTGTGLDDVGLVPALKRLNQVHLNFPATHNTMGKNFAYTLGLLGQVDTTVEADTASYGVFKSGSKRTYIAYNPTATQITVVFTDKATSKQLGLLVPPFSMASHVDGEEPQVYKQTPVVEDKLRLYLRGGGTLSATPGSFMLPEGETSFPADIVALQPQLSVVPVRSDPTSTPLILPKANEIVSWTGKFSGSRIGGTKPLTRFSLFTNESLFPGWQQDNTKAPNTVTARFNYDFDSDGVYDRVEILQNVPLFAGNAFLFKSKITEYYFNQIYGGIIGQIPVFVGDGKGGGVQPFPLTVADGTIQVQIYGGSGPQPLFPVNVSVDASPLINRASWVKPPYGPAPPRPPLLSPPPGSCPTVACLSAPDYYLLHLDRLPRGSVIISGSNLNAPVSTSNKTKMKLALDGGSSPRDQFNRQYVSLQLSLLAAPGLESGEESARLVCYGPFDAVTLSNGENVTGFTTLQQFLGILRWVATSGSSSDLVEIAKLLDAITPDEEGQRCGTDEAPVTPQN